MLARLCPRLSPPPWLVCVAPAACSQVLFNLYEGLVASTDPSAANRQRRVLEAIGLFATIAPKDLVTAFFNRLFRMLVESVNALAEDASGGMLSLAGVTGGGGACTYFP